MWHLLEHVNRLDTRTEFTNELLIGLFWEESVFQNWWQLGNNGQPLKQYAAGFGQIERNTLNIINALYPDKRYRYSPEKMIEDPVMSVSASVDYLRHLRKTFTRSNKRDILKKYGGAGAGGSTNVDKKVDQWLACENILFGSSSFSEDVVTKALNAAEPNHAANVGYVVDSSY
jgi:hypothetical protein